MDLRANKIIACDFDGTLCENAWPEIGKAKEAVIWYLRKRQAEGDKIILWTCRTGELLEDAVRWCYDQGLIFNEVNANLPEVIESMGGDTRKIYADEYIDDKNVSLRTVELEYLCSEVDYSVFDRTYDLPPLDLRKILKHNAVLDETPEKTDEEVRDMVDEMKQRFAERIHKDFMESY